LEPGLSVFPFALGLMHRNIPVTIYEQGSGLKDSGAGIGI
jgi:hypothetical protein